MKILYFILAFIFSNSYAQTLADLDQKYYSPQLKGVSDLAFEFAIVNQTKMLNDQMIFGKLKNVYYKVYWTKNPERVDVVVFGLPEGFKEIKEELKATVYSKLEFILPLPFQRKFKEFEISRLAQSLDWKLKDKTGQSPYMDYIFKFSKEGALEQMIGTRTGGEVKIKFLNNKFPWSEQKWVVQGIETESIEGGQNSHTKTNMSFEVVKGIGFVSRVQSKTTLKVQMDPKTRPIERSSDEEFRFSNIKVNEGLALRWFSSGNQE